MALAASGPISFNAINTELGVAGTTQASLNQLTYRTLAETPSGQISLKSFYGKSASINYVFTASTANATLNVTTISGYVAGRSNIVVTVNSGVYLYSTTTGTAGLTLTGGVTGDTVTLVNNGFIMGLGGDGESFDSGGTTILAATAGSLALSIGFDTTVTNTSGYIGGGGGASGGDWYATGAGGAGGGAGGSTLTFSTGGAGGAFGAAGGNGTASSYYASGGGGGRILPGTGGSGGSVAGTSTASSPGLGGGSGGGGSAIASVNLFSALIAASGGGGGWGASGGTAYESGTRSTATGGAGGSAGAAGGDGSVSSPLSSFAGTPGGSAVALNGKLITWTGGTASSSRAYGAVA